MTCPAYTPPSAPKACPWKLRGVVRGVFCFLIALLIACVPVSAVSLFSIDTPSFFAMYDWDGTNGNTAYADTVDPYNSFIDEMAEQAGLTPAQYIATVTGVSNIVSGVNFIRDGGVMGAVNDAAATTANNLSSLIDAADYPAWSSLDASTQESYGSQEAYNAAKFNSLMEAFGLDTARSRYYASGGGNFEWQNDELEKLQQLGRIGSNWASGAANTFSSLQGTVTNNNYFVPWTGASEHAIFDATGKSGWYETVPLQVNVAKTNLQWNYATTTTNAYIALGTSRDVYMCTWTAKASENGATSTFVYAFDLDNAPAWTYTTAYYISASNVIQPPDLSGNNWISPTRTVYDGTYFYRASYSYGQGSTNYPNVLTSGTVVSANYERDMNRAIAIMCKNASELEFSDDAPKVEDYPEEQPSGDTNIYFPIGGIAVNTGWPAYTTSPSTPRPETDWNPDNQTGGNQWKDDTTANVIPLMGIEFDKLFPFCLLYDVSTLFDKVQANFEDDGEAYNVIEVPIEYDSNSETDLDLDLTWLHDLAVIVRPFFQILLAVSLLFVTVWFWQSILTG